MLYALRRCRTDQFVNSHVPKTLHAINESALLRITVAVMRYNINALQCFDNITLMRNTAVIKVRYSHDHFVLWVIRINVILSVH